MGKEMCLTQLHKSYIIRIKMLTSLTYDSMAIKEQIVSILVSRSDIDSSRGRFGCILVNFVTIYLAITPKNLQLFKIVIFTASESHTGP